MKTYVVLSLCLGLTLATALQAGERPEPLPDQKDQVSKLMAPCPAGLERFLPGDYYFCAATRHYWSGAFGAARESLKDAAAWASKPAQYALGIMYFNGDRTEKNRPLGLAWLALAAERHDPVYEPAFISAFKSVSPDELAQANVYWTELKAKYADAVAGPRAERRFDREYRQILWLANFGGGIFIDGVTAPSGTDPSIGGGVQSGLSFTHYLREQKEEFFYGYSEHVTVGDMQLVPISDVVRRTQKSSPDHPVGE
ncbi:MAG: hypothetical protein GAK28_04454 [Luteibacter sp.]|uniref:hypothetical protein n=1 Tax=Luteibacter sp. TaxID=1886636 RepID=UPI0013825967|nr:hypothetical protein [Luteibacter sp.]KAF1003800.1 MAG: hypothetical protein GAK28_04454 [Luteibacter sp.]